MEQPDARNEAGNTQAGDWHFLEQTPDYLVDGPTFVKCPRCSGPTVLDQRLHCRGCGYYHVFDLADNRDYEFIRAHDNFYYSTLFEGNLLWASNVNHIDWLIDYLGADRRHRAPNFNRSMASRLPSWLKKADKEKVVKALQKLRKLPLPA